MITISHVSKSFGRFKALDDVSINIARGESVALWGANGAGKSTLIKCVLGLHRFDGAIGVSGHDALHDGKRARMLVGYVPQELGFYDDLGVAEALRFFARLKSLTLSDPRATLASVGLDGHQTKRVRELSGGMKQRLALAIALLGDPPVLVLDEVTASLDACGRDEFVSLLSRLAGGGRTMLFASHRMEEVAALAQNVVMLKAGRIDRCLSVVEFTSSQTTGLVLHLVMPVPVRHAAIARLRESGFEPAMNGVGIIVPVSAQQKAAPLRILAEARISIDDFEVITHPVASSIHGGTP
jgi:ABC-type multidrug transport system ATPase subunit